MPLAVATVRPNWMYLVNLLPNYPALDHSICLFETLNRYLLLEAYPAVVEVSQRLPLQLPIWENLVTNCRCLRLSSLQPNDPRPTNGLEQRVRLLQEPWDRHPRRIGLENLLQLLQRPIVTNQASKSSHCLLHPQRTSYLLVLKISLIHDAEV